MSRGPSPASRALLSMLGILFIFLGIVLMILGFLAPTSKVQAGGLILIGPIIIFILMLFLMLKRISMEERG